MPHTPFRRLVSPDPSNGVKGDKVYAETFNDIYDAIEASAKLTDLQSPVNLQGVLTSTGDLPDDGNTTGDAYLVNGIVWVWDGGAWTNQGSLTVGEQGDPALLNLKGTVALEADLPASGNVINDVWVVEADGHGWAWTADHEWVDVGTMQGPPGDLDATVGPGTAGEYLAVGPGDTPEWRTNILIDARDYGALSSDSGDAAANVTTLEAAATAAGAVRGTVQVPAMSIPINSDVAFPAYAGLMGAGREATTFLATHANARLTFNEPSFSVIENFTVDGADIATQAMRIIGATNKVSLRDVQVTRGIRSLCIHAVQNSMFDNLTVENSVKGLEILDGCGNLVFNGMNVATCEYWLVKLGYEGVEASGYTESNTITFIAPMLEFYSAATANTEANIVIEGGARITFITPTVAHGDPDPMLKMSLVSPATETSVTLIGASFLGDPSDSIGVSMASDTGLTIVGRNLFTAMATGVVASGTNIRISGDPIEFNNVTTNYSIGGGTDLPTVKSVSDDRQISHHAPVAGVTYPYRVYANGESSPRLAINSAGQLEWSDGSGALDTSLYRAGGMVHSDQMLSGYGGLRSGDGSWNGGHLRLEPYHLWIDSTGDLRIKNGAPSSDTDGTIVGTQS